MIVTPTQLQQWCWPEAKEVLYYQYAQETHPWRLGLAQNKHFRVSDLQRLGIIPVRNDRRMHQRHRLTDIDIVTLFTDS
jgi:hypothetical protein